MTKLVKRFMAVLVSTMCLAFGTNVSAESVTPTSDTPSAVIGRSTISGYEQFTFSKEHPSNVIYCNAEGWGGMGITIKNHCSANYRIGVSVFEGGSGRVLVDNATAYTNGEVQFHDLVHYSSNPYIIQFHDIPEGVSFVSDIWIYG